MTILAIEPGIGKVLVPRDILRSISLPGLNTRRMGREIGIFRVVQRRAFDAQGREWWGGDGEAFGLPKIFKPLMLSITHNERVDSGALEQKGLVFVTGTSAFKVLAVANATLTKAKSDLSLGSASANVTTNEFTASGLSRANGTVQNYVAPASLGATFAIDIVKTFTATGSVTGKGAGVYNSTTVSGSLLYAEDNFASDAVLVNNDTLTITVTVTN